MQDRDSVVQDLKKYGSKYRDNSQSGKLCLKSMHMAPSSDGLGFLRRSGIPSPVLVVPPECVETSVICPDRATLPMQVRVWQSTVVMLVNVCLHHLRNWRKTVIMSIIAGGIITGERPSVNTDIPPSNVHLNSNLQG
jgi:hypothetical protein